MTSLPSQLLARATLPERFGPGGLRLAGPYLVGLAVLALLMALTAVDASGRVVLWENAHWTWSYGLGFIVVLMGAHRATGRTRQIRALFALGFLSQFIGQIVWDVQAAQNVQALHALPAPSDAFFLGLGIPVLAGFALAVRSSVRPGQQTAAYLDAATVFVALVTVALAFYQTLIPDAPPLQAAVLLAYPIVFISTAGAGFIMAAAGGLPVSKAGHYPLLLGLVVSGLAWVLWNTAAITTFPAAGSPVNYVFDLGAVVASYGAATWSLPGRTNVRSASGDRLLLGMVPIAMVGVAILASLLTNATGNLAVEASSAVVVVLALARQAVLIRERNALLADQAAAVAAAQLAAERERATMIELQSAFDAQRQSEERYRAVVEVFDRLGEQMTFAADESDLVRAAAAAVRRLVPNDGGDVLVINPSQDHLIVAARWGADAAPVGSTVEVDSPVRCLGIRRGSTYFVEDAADDMRLPCPAHRVERGSVLCVPMVGLGQIVGVIHIERAGGPIENDAQRQASRVAEQVALAITNARMLRTMEGLALIDPLTGLHNGQFFDLLLDRELAMADRPGDAVGIVMIDVDHFKQFNDRHGHPTGDEALRVFARVAQGVLRPSDAIARYGGGVFVVLVHKGDLTTTSDIAERIRAAVEETQIEIGFDRVAQVTVSCGVATSALHGSGRPRLMKIAEKALVRAKRLGRNRVVTPALRRGPNESADAPIRIDARR